MDKVLLIDTADNVVTALEPVQTGDSFSVGTSAGVAFFVAAQDIAMGHKLAVRKIPVGEKVFKYGAAIGEAKQDIQAGEHVHSHNLMGFRGRE